LPPFQNGGDERERGLRLWLIRELEQRCRSEQGAVPQLVVQDRGVVRRDSHRMNPCVPWPASSILLHFNPNQPQGEGTAATAEVVQRVREVLEWLV
jgi:hypothetical protein